MQRAKAGLHPQSLWEARDARRPIGLQIVDPAAMRQNNTRPNARFFRKVSRIILFGMAVSLLGGAPAGGADDPSLNDPSPNAGQKINPALERFGRSIILYAGFDGHVNAEILQGNPVPQGGAGWTNAVKNPSALFAPGIYGQGFKPANHKLTYWGTNDVLGTTGAIVMWIKPEKLNHKGHYFWPIQLIAQGYSVMFGRIGDLRNKEKLYAHLAGSSAFQGSMAKWQPGAWHLFVVNWDRTGIEISLDGNIPGRASLKAPLKSDAAGKFRVHLNGANEDEFVFDELLVLDIALNADEIRRLYEEGKQVK